MAADGTLVLLLRDSDWDYFAKCWSVEREALTLWLQLQVEENLSELWDKSKRQTKVWTLQIKTLKGQQCSVAITEKDSSRSRAQLERFFFFTLITPGCCQEGLLQVIHCIFPRPCSAGPANELSLRAGRANSHKASLCILGVSGCILFKK